MEFDRNCGSIQTSRSILGSVKADVPFDQRIGLGDVATLELKASSEAEVSVGCVYGGHLIVDAGHRARITIGDGHASRLTLKLASEAKFTFVGMAKQSTVRAGFGAEVEIASMYQGAVMKIGSGASIRVSGGELSRLEFDASTEVHAVILAKLTGEVKLKLASQARLELKEVMADNIRLDAGYESEIKIVHLTAQLVAKLASRATLRVYGGRVSTLELDGGYESKLELLAVVDLAQVKLASSSRCVLGGIHGEATLDLGHKAECELRAGDLPQVSLKMSSDARLRVPGCVLSGSLDLGYQAVVEAAGYNYDRLSIKKGSGAQLLTI